MGRFALVVLGLALGCAPCREDVERGLLAEIGDPPWKRLTLEERMEHYGVPGVGIAVVNDFEIEWAKGYGTLDPRLQAASIGKPVVAVAAMQLVEQGRLDLDEDVNARLESWKVPNSRGEVTLRRLLSHSAGIVKFGYQGYAHGAPLPTLNQILDGEPPANSPPVRLVKKPDTEFLYSNGGYMIVQRLVMDVTGEPFAPFLAESVLEPAGMIRSTFEYPQAGAPGRVYPEMGCGASLWSTPSDLARFGIEMMRAYRGEPNALLSQATAREMLKRQTPDGRSYGLGFNVGEEGTRYFNFSHDGGNEGYRCILAMYPELGRGAVIMTNANSGDRLWREILNGISVEYGLVRGLGPEHALAAIGLLVVAVGVWIVIRRRRVPKRNTDREDGSQRNRETR